MGYLKQNEVKPSKSKKPPKKREDAKKPEPVCVAVTGPETPGSSHAESLQHDINHVAGLIDIRDSLESIANGLSRLTSDAHDIQVSARYGAPVRLTLADNDEEDTMGRFVTAFERIADSVARLAGLSRPRLESWHEQCEYEPRYKSIACDGGAPGPAAK
jgi:hypothetical protein